MNFPLNFSFFLNYYNFFFLAWGNIFWELKKNSGTNGPVVPILFTPLRSVLLGLKPRASSASGFRPNKTRLRVY